MQGWTPDTIADAVLKLGVPIAVAAAAVYLVAKLIDLTKVWIQRKK